MRTLFEKCLKGGKDAIAVEERNHISYTKWRKKNEYSYGGITIFSTFNRLYDRILDYFLEKECQDREDGVQAGFRTQMNMSFK